MTTATLPALTTSRLAVGLLQAVWLVLLRQALVHRAWPADSPALFGALLVVGVLVPPLLISGLGNLRARTLVIWIPVAALLCAALAVHGAWAYPTIADAALLISAVVPRWQAWLSLAAILLVLHSLVLAGDAERRAFGSYPSLFDASWKLAFQLTLSAGFIAVLACLLLLGAQLLDLIGLDFLDRLTEQWLFWIPVIAVAASYALHVTDVRASIVTGARTLMLSLLGWLLPVFVLVTGAFVVALPFTGLEPLWGTRSAAAILLSCAAMLVVLINAAYQDGSAERRAPAVLRVAASLGAALLLPLVALAAYALALRVGQYGWTADRIVAVAITVLLAGYALGYALALLGGRRGGRFFERSNLLCALGAVAVLLALHTPLADPARLATSDQVDRLRSGKIAPEQFDFGFLRFDAGQYGKRALAALAAPGDGPQDAAIAKLAQQAQAANTRWLLEEEAEQTRNALTPQQRAANIQVIQPPGAALPDSFLNQDWADRLPSRHHAPCLVETATCDAILTDLNGDGEPEVLLFMSPHGGPVGVFDQAAERGWTYRGNLSNTYCPGAREGLRAGKFELAPPAPLRDLSVNGQRLALQWDCEADQGRPEK